MDILTWSFQAFCWLYRTAAPRLLAGLMPVPVIGMVARCTTNTANPIGSGTNTCIYMHTVKHKLNMHVTKVN